jgi:phosphate acyltransferase
VTATTGITVAVDAMGGDHAPGALVMGAVAAIHDMGVRVLLVGRPEVVEPLVEERARAGSFARDPSLRPEVVAAAEVVEMAEHPAQAVRAKRDSSIVRACELVAQGRAQAVVSAGNSGAVLAAALFTLRRIPGVARPAIGALLPGLESRTFLLDVGANADVRPEWLAQFAVMGSVYARAMMGVAEPRVALLSNGEEPGKGSALIQTAHPLLAAAPIRFTGNVEGRELLNGVCDVAVTDGFTGNVALKTAEGVGEYLFTVLRREARASRRAMLGGLLLKPRLRAVRDQADYRATGGALLLGIAGEVVVAHGRSDATAVANAIGVARTAVESRVSGTIAAALVRDAAAAALTTKELP